MIEFVTPGGQAAIVVRTIAIAIVLGAAGGCATHHPASLVESPVARAEGAHIAAAQEEPGPSDVVAPVDDAARAEVEAMRTLSQTSRSLPRQSSLPTIEGSDPVLARALAMLAAVPGAANHRRVADAYLRVSVLDTAFDHFADALELDRRDGAALDGMARIWRDWGFPERGLADAYRAVYFAPGSPEALNTLAGLLQVLGQRTAARETYERALAIAPGSAYILNNLCYLLHLDGDGAKAEASCRAALQAEPLMVAAHNNLGLVLAARGDFAGAAREFALVSSPAAAQYNLGVAYFAAERFTDSADAFDSAAVLMRTPATALAHARQARDLAKRRGPQADTPRDH